MKRKFFFLATFLCWQVTAAAADLMEVYGRAQQFDPIFQREIAQTFAIKEGFSISVAALLPNIALAFNPSVVRFGYTGTNFINASIFPRNNTQRAYNLNLSLSQTVFNFAQFAIVAEQAAISKEADATLNAALQDLMIRTAQAYFAVLRDVDNLYYSRESELAFAKQLDLVKHQLVKRVATITDFYTAKASYDTAIADRVTAEISLANDRENLRKITGVYYENLSRLGKNVAIQTPRPDKVEAWVKTAITQNWSIKAAQYNVIAARKAISQQMGGHFPTISVQGTLSRQYADNINDYNAFNLPGGPGSISEREIGLSINMPLFAGGGVVAEVRQAKYNYEAAVQQLDGTIANITTATRQAFNNVTLGVLRVKIDEEAIKSNAVSVKGLKISHRAGIETLIDVLHQQQNLFQSQIQYATHRYQIINDYLVLKQATGVLSYNDLFEINTLLTRKEAVV